MNNIFPKNLITICMLILLTVNSYSQKEDNIWLVEFAPDEQPLDSEYGGVEFDFNKSPVKINYVKYDRGKVGEWNERRFWKSNAGICNTKGEALFYCNGYHILNKQYEIMENGQHLVDKRKHKNGYERVVRQGVLALPFPTYDNKYVIIYGKEEFVDFEINLVEVMKELSYAVVDMSANEGLGKVEERAILISKELFCPGLITACQHGNGRDWWILLAKANSETIFTYLLDEKGISLYDSIKLNKKIPLGEGLARFSLDGTKYAHVKSFAKEGGFRIYGGIDIDLFDFDRCSGSLSNHISIYEDPALDTIYDVSVEFSPNSKIMYVNDSWHVLQYDLSKNNVALSKQLVATFEGSKFHHFGDRFNMLQNAPDGRIFLSTGGSHYMHLIHDPDSLGIKCNVEQLAIEIPDKMGGILPNYPNFKLGRLVGSNCDTLTLTKHLLYTEKSEVTIFPNPTSGHFKLNMSSPPRDDFRVEVLQRNGQLLLSRDFNSWDNHLINLSGFPNGVYFVRVTTKEGIALRKIVKI